jgi:hypothetical protein
VEQDRLLLAKVEELGHHWKALEAFFPGQSNVNIKNHWRHLTNIPRPMDPKQKSQADPQAVFDRLFESCFGE